MQTIKKVKYNIERVDNNTFCAMSCDLEYIMSHLEGANTVASSAGTSVFLKIATSKEKEIFMKNLTYWGLTIDNSTITVVTKITLSKNDVDDQAVANRIVRDKAMHTMCKVVANALQQALNSTYNRIARVENIIDKLNHIAYPLKYGKNDVEYDPEDCPDPADDAVDVADLL